MEKRIKRIFWQQFEPLCCVQVFSCKKVKQAHMCSSGDNKYKFEFWNKFIVYQCWILWKKQTNAFFGSSSNDFIVWTCLRAKKLSKCICVQVVTTNEKINFDLVLLCKKEKRAHFVEAVKVVYIIFIKCFRANRVTWWRTCLCYL